MTFGEKLKYARKYRGTTQKDIADEMGIAKATYSGYEIDRRFPDVLKIKQLCQILSVNADWLLGFDVPMEKEEVQTQQCENYEECQKKDIKPLISKILQLDERDKGKISERVDMLLESDKYNYQKELKHA